MLKLRPWQANALLLLAACIWGSAFVPQSWGGKDVDPFLFTGLRFALGTLVVLPLAMREWRQMDGPSVAAFRTQFWPMVGLGLLIFLGVAMQQIGLGTTTVTNAAVLTALYVPLTPILGWLLHGRRPHWVVWPCGLACVLGSWLLAGGGGFDFAVGDVWVLVSSLFWALHLVYVGRIAGKLHGPFVLSFLQFGVCTVASLAVAAVLEPWVLDKLIKASAAIAYTGFLSVGLGYTLQVVGQRQAHAAHAAIILSSETLFAALFGAVLMGDRMSAVGWVGCGLILGSIVLVQFEPKPRP